MTEKKRTRLEEKWESELAGADGEAAADTAAVEDGADAAEEAHGHTAVDEIQVRDAEIARLTDQLLRQRAEMANFRRRMERDQADSIRDAKASLIGRLIPVLDDFERAVAVSGGDVENYREGVELILRSFRDVLKSIGVARLAPRGRPFDPELHEAVERAETSAVPEGYVTDVFQVGYQLDGRLVRPARVSVAVPPQAPASDDADADADD